MSYLRPCVRCRFDGDCAEQRLMRQSIKTANLENQLVQAVPGAAPLRITSVLFTCEKRWRGFEAGRRVRVAFRYPDGFVYDDVFFAIERIGGWITEINHGPAPGKVVIWLDRETSYKEKRRIRLWPVTQTGDIRIVLGKARRPVEEIRREMEEAAAAYDGREWEDRP